ncbi:MAG TPA: M14 family zinc carboxypeptidase [Thermoanaerobaculia bacterium]|nr:M14 family zinc carboxypeptidase [Thermoanaerobaculia bacterium]
MPRRLAALLAVLCLAASAAGAQAPAAAAKPPLLAPLSGGQELPLPAATEAAVPSPAEVLGYPLGSRFTHWDRIVEALAAIDHASDRVTMWEYGRTYEGRPLQLVAVSAPANIARLEAIRAERLRLADPAGLAAGERERLVRELPVVVWLAYGVHGNESSSAEAAMATAWLLAAAGGETAELLRDTVVLIDPLSNPDGRERYVHAYEQRTGSRPNPDPAAAEHFEPWPGGRHNHYLLDLNRDWAWASQQETRHRLAAYRQWEPLVYVDFHEMGTESTYFFPPAAEPIHPRIDRALVSWLDAFGRANAQAFERQGWIYYTGENFDLFYPGYGDSYPSLRGAVGMTYEMAGGGRAGAALALPDGSTLTLADRVARHLTTSLATVRTAAQNRRRLLEDYAAARTPPRGEDARTFLWPADQQEARALADLLALHGVRVEQLAEEATLPARPLTAAAGEAASPRQFAAGTFAVSTAQPLGDLVEALMELEAPMSPGFLERQRSRIEQDLSPEFYDITAWSLPLAFNVRTWVAAGTPRGLRPAEEGRSAVRGSGELGWLVPPQGLASYRLAARLQEKAVPHRIALQPFTAAGTAFPSGTLFVPRPRGGSAADTAAAATLTGALEELALTAHRIGSSYELKGLSLGSDDMAAVRRSRVGLVAGDGVDPTSFGFLWHLLDREVGVPHRRVDVERLGDLDLWSFDVLVLPDGFDYDGAIGEKTREQLTAWVRSGGVLVAVGGAVEWLQDHELTKIKRWKPPEKDPEEGEDEERMKGPEDRPLFTPGAALATTMRASHPLTLGLQSPPAVLVEGTTVLLPTGEPRQDVVVAAEDDPVVAGFAWPEAEERLAGALLVGSERVGAGSLVLFAQDPSFRLFWRATTPLLLNAVLYGPSIGLGGRG